MINFYYDRIVDGVTIPNGIPENFVKYYNPFFNYPLFREEVGFEPAVYPSDIRQHGLTEISVDSIDKNDSGAYEIWKNTLFLYIFYVLLTKNKWYFSIPIILLVLIDQTILSENKYLEKIMSENNDENNDKNISNTIKNYEKYRLYLQYTIIGLIIIGFIHYLIRQKIKFKNKFNLFTFIFDVKCKTDSLNIRNFT